MEATKKQQEYLTILFIDCNFTRQQRNAYLSDELGREITALDELTSSEASNFITELLEIKERSRLRAFGHETDEDEE